MAGREMGHLVRFLGCILLLSVLAACGGGGGGGQRTVAGIPTGFSDASPHPWSGRTPRDYPVHGVDVSKFQGRIDWQRAANAGVSFAFIKATEGGDRFDPMYDENAANARRRGIPVGAYHFYYFCRSAEEQARWFIKNVPRLPGALPPVLDMEWNAYSPTCKLRPSPEVVRSEAQIFLRILTDHYGQRPIIYTAIDFWERNQMSRLTGYEYWLRSVAGHPSEVYGDAQRWTFWQYTGTGLIPGFNGQVDINAFRGSAADWSDWVASRSR